MGASFQILELIVVALRGKAWAILDRRTEGADLLQALGTFVLGKKQGKPARSRGSC